jgi:uncharacterized protein YndB with AHSA1/START domain
MLIRLLSVIVFACVLANSASADVLAASREGFSLRVLTTTRASPAQAYEAFVRIGEWWHPDHSYFGSADNMSLDMRPGGAFLETSPGGGWVKHLELVYANPGKEIRLLGGLGPLQAMGLDGALTVQFTAIADGGTTVTMLYNVSGFANTGLENLAPIVDRVQTEQMQRHAAFADSLAGGD